jgi:mannosyltransferase OCH1-like enzyme
MIPRIIHHKTSRGLSPEEVRLAHRLRTLLPGWEYRLWNDQDSDTLVRNQFPQHLSSYRSIKHGVVKVDVLRFMFLYVYGGFYFDTDYKLLRSIDDDMLSHSCILPLSRDTDSLFRIGNAAIGAQPGHPICKDYVDHVFSNPQLSDLAEANIEKTTGPEGFTSFYLGHRNYYKDIFMPQKEVFHPYITRMGFSYKRKSETMGVHLCWGSWRTKSLLGNLKNLARRKLTSLY